MDFETWMKQCRQIAKEKGLHLPADLNEDQVFDWKNQFDNSMSPSEAVYYFMQNSQEG